MFTPLLEFSPKTHKHKPLIPTWRSWLHPYYWRSSKPQHTGHPGEGGLPHTVWIQAKMRLLASSLLALVATGRKKWIDKETEPLEDHILPQQPPRNAQSRQVGTPVPAWVFASHNSRHHGTHLVPTSLQSGRQEAGGRAQGCEAAAWNRDCHQLQEPLLFLWSKRLKEGERKI